MTGCAEHFVTLLESGNLPQVHGEAIAAVVHGEFGDGNVSAIDFECHVDRVDADDGDRVRTTDGGTFLL